MSTSGLQIDQLSQVISQATAPAFLLGAVAAFIAVLIGESITHLKRRARLMNKAIEFAVISGIFTTLLVIVAFATAALGLNHAYGAAILFVLALGFFATSLVYLWIEVRIPVNELAYFP